MEDILSAWVASGVQKSLWCQMDAWWNMSIITTAEEATDNTLIKAFLCMNSIHVMGDNVMLTLRGAILLFSPRAA